MNDKQPLIIAGGRGSSKSLLQLFLLRQTLNKSKKPEWVIENYLNNALRFILNGHYDTAMSEIMYAIKSLDMNVYPDIEKEIGL